MALIDLQNVGLTFHVRTFGRVTFKEYLIKGMFLRRASSTMEVRALEDVNLRMAEGRAWESLGPTEQAKARCYACSPEFTDRRPDAGSWSAKSPRCSKSRLDSKWRPAAGRTSPFAAIFRARRLRDASPQDRANRGVQRIGRLSENARTLLLGRHDGAARVFDRHDDRTRNPDRR